MHCPYDKVLIVKRIWMILVIPEPAQLRQIVIRLMVNGAKLKTNDHPPGAKMRLGLKNKPVNKTDFLTRENTPLNAIDNIVFLD